MPRDYYIVLGIEQGASLSEIKKAYRNAIKRYHPDKTGMSTDLHKFRAAREAYEVLSDAEKRRAYDADRQPQGTPVRSEEVPKAATHRYRTRPTFPKTPLRDPFPESMIADSHRHHRYRPANGYDLYVEVTLTAREALHGGTFPLTLPVAAPCSHCFNRWGHPDVTCPVCGGYGVVRSRRSLELHLPPDLSDGTLLTVSFDPVGLGEITLLIVVRVRGSGMYFWRY